MIDHPADESKTVDVCRKRGISEATFYKWKAKFGGLDVSDARRLRQLEDENARLNRLLADAVLDNAVLKDIAAKNGDASCHEGRCESLRDAHGLSERRACAILAADPTSVRYVNPRGDDAALRARRLALAHERRRFCYRRVGLLLAREGLAPNHKKLRRIYADERLQVRRRGGPSGRWARARRWRCRRLPNQRWSLDFVSDTLTAGRRLRVLCVVDDFTRECLALVADTPLPGKRVVRELGAIAAQRGYPTTIVSDNRAAIPRIDVSEADRGTALTSSAMLT